MLEKNRALCGLRHKEFANNLRAAGYKLGNSGSMYTVGSYGFYWSSTSDSTSGAYTLYFNSGGTGVDGGYARSNGMSVRCIEE